MVATTLPAGETFTTIRAAGLGELFRGVAFAPNCLDEDQGKDQGNH